MQDKCQSDDQQFILIFLGNKGEKKILILKNIHFIGFFSNKMDSTPAILFDMGQQIFG